jgi:hypothetical protein
MRFCRQFYSYICMGDIHSNKLCVLTGLIVGALIKYTTHTSTAVTLDVGDTSNLSTDKYNPPSYIRLTVHFQNDTNASNVVEVDQQQYEYSLQSLIPPQEQNSSTQTRTGIELETTVNHLILLLCFWHHQLSLQP